MTNSFKNPLYFTSDGQKWWIKFIIKPLIWEPSISWSVIIITEPYLSDFKSTYCLSFYSPIILIKFSISSFYIIYLTDASLTFNSLPFKGNTPYLSLPTISIPAIANALAESPSVNINVQNSEFFFPASLASSNFSIPCNLAVFVPFNCLFSFASALALAC